MAKILPRPRAYTGRPAYSNLDLLPGILKVLRSGCRWRDLDSSKYPSGVTHWRRLRFWQDKLGLRKTWNWILRKLHKKRKLNFKRASLDGSLIPSFRFSDTTGYSGKYKKTGTKISSLVDSGGLPLGLVLAPGNKHDLPLAIPTISSLAVNLPETVIADKGYDSFDFRQKLIQFGIIANISPRRFKNRKHKYKYSKTLGKLRYKVERTNAWIKSFRKLHFRFDYTLTSFQAFAYLAVIVICLRRLLP